MQIIDAYICNLHIYACIAYKVLQIYFCAYIHISKCAALLIMPRLLAIPMHSYVLHFIFLFNSRNEEDLQIHFLYKLKVGVPLMLDNIEPNTYLCA